MFLAVLLPNGCYLIKTAILRRKHTIFFALPDKNLSIPNKKIREKLSSLSEIVNVGLYFIFLFLFYLRVRVEHNITCHMTPSQ